MSAFPYTSFPFNVTAISPLFHLSPVSSSASLGWVPSCTLPECIPTASWSTGATNSTLSFNYWGWGVELNGNVKGNMSVELFHDGGRVMWDPSGDTLFNIRGDSAGYEQLEQRNITLRVLDASPGSQLTVTQARVNGSTRADYNWPADRWVVSSDDERLEYTGFAQQASEGKAQSSTTYSSSRTGDSVSMQFNGSAFLVYGPCGPTNGLMRVTIDGIEQIVNTSRPFASNDCLLFQSPGQVVHSLHQFLIENVDGRTLSIGRLEFIRIQMYKKGGMGIVRTTVVSSTIAAILAVFWVVIVIYLLKARRKQVSGVDGPRPNHQGFQWLHS
ncbi:unnamed protein product [Rhizoctonia solani]|uniref:Uncharacterized protein n=1 Tax=Rhizoctonia solani TaxID=456999 RepID=A0A8H3I2K2_9AGAM|nr:unnamed protein product [Rhizoctonia solani]